MTEFQVGWTSLTVKVAVTFDPPMVGPFGYMEERMAVKEATFQVSPNVNTGKPELDYNTGRGVVVRKDGSIGTKAAVAYGLYDNRLPEDLVAAVMLAYDTAVKSAASA